MFEEILSGYSSDIKNLFEQLRILLLDSVGVPVEEKIWAKLPSFYYQDKFVRLIPFKNHINVEAKAIKDSMYELPDYKITPMGMLKIETKQAIPTEYLSKVFFDTLLRSPIPLTRQLQALAYSDWSTDAKDFVVRYNEAMEAIGYTCNNEIVDGICYGKYMMIYRKQKVKSDKVYARIYFRSNGIFLRLFLSGIDKHGEYIGKCPDYIKETFTGDYAKCNYCRGADCRFRKSYVIDGVRYEKCNGQTFEFFSPNARQVNEYIKLIQEFYR
ncbi:MAG: hypothetical protein PHX51_08220 [Clostridia bacterium]|nr:hypothetical protein [Clostridia bacterium]